MRGPPSAFTLSGMNETVERLRSNLGRVILGKARELDQVLAAFLAGGNVLLTDVPGVGKTTLAKAIAASISGTFRRLQFTPDLLPADILGGSVYDPREGSFRFRRGPVFANVLLADEINRASPRTQSSLLEAMAEGQVSIEGETHPLPRPFWVIATQNPVEFHGTYPLPEAQLDRFAVQLSIGYPPEEEEVRIVSGQGGSDPLAKLGSAATLEEVLELQGRVRAIHVDSDLDRYVVAIARASREEPRLELGVSPRGALALVRMSRAWAFLAGRDAVLPDDVKTMAIETLAHRVILDSKAKYSGVTKVEVIRDLLEKVRVPV